MIISMEDINSYHDLKNKIEAEVKIFADLFAERIKLVYDYREIDLYPTGIDITYHDKDFVEVVSIPNEAVLDISKWVTIASSNYFKIEKENKLKELKAKLKNIEYHNLSGLKDAKDFKDKIEILSKELEC